MVLIFLCPALDIEPGDPRCETSTGQTKEASPQWGVPQASALSLLARNERRARSKGEQRRLSERNTGSSPTVTTTNPVGVQVQRLPDFFAYPSRVRTFRSQEYALFCQRGTQKGYAVHLKTAYPWKHFVHIHRDALANFRFFHQKHKQLTSSFSFEFRMPNRKKFQKIINTHLVAVL